MLYQVEHREGLTLKLFSKRSQKPKFQCLIAERGQTPEWLEAIELTSLGAYSTPSIGEFPSVGVESSLWQVLEADAPERYYLSKKACEGIIRRAANRGKTLPKLLETALLYRIATAESDPKDKNSTSAPPGNLLEKLQAVYGFCSSSSNSMKSNNPNSGIYEAEIIRTLDSQGGNPTCNQGGMIVVEKEAKAIHESLSGDSVHISDVAYALRSGRKPLLVEEINLHPEIAPTLTASAGGTSRPGGGQGSELDYYMAYAIQGNMINRADKNGPQGGGINENNCFTLNATDQHAVAFFNHSHNANIPSQGKTASCQIARQHKQIPIDLVVPYYIVRRLTPTECERLQGFPDGWTKFGAGSDKKIADTPRYQMLGNSVAIPCVRFILGNIAAVEKSCKQSENAREEAF